MLCREGVADHIADVVGDQFDLADFQRVEGACDVFSLRLLVVTTGWMGGQTHAAQVRYDYCVVMCQHGAERRPHVAGLAITMKQDDRRTLAAEANMNCYAVGLDFLCAE